MQSSEDYLIDLYSTSKDLYKLVEKSDNEKPNFTGGIFIENCVLYN